MRSRLFGPLLITSGMLALGGVLVSGYGGPRSILAKTPVNTGDLWFTGPIFSFARGGTFPVIASGSPASTYQFYWKGITTPPTEIQLRIEAGTNLNFDLIVLPVVADVFETWPIVENNQTLGYEIVLHDHFPGFRRTFVGPPLGHENYWYPTGDYLLHVTVTNANNEMFSTTTSFSVIHPMDDPNAHEAGN